jgi:TRAP-type transport system periplasmic protein
LKKIVISLAIILVLMATILGSCTSTPVTSTAVVTSVTTATSAVTTTATSTATATLAPVIIRLAPVTAGPPPALGLSLVARDTAAAIEKATGGKVKFEIYYSETLAKGTELVSAVQNNIANMAFLRTFSEPGKLPLSVACELPGVWTDAWAGLSAFNDLMKQDPIKSELAKYNMIGYSSVMILNQQLIANKSIASLADLQGKKISAKGVAATVYQQLGAVPVAMSPTEEYEGLGRGTVDGISAPLDAIQSFKFYEAGKFYITIQTVPRLHPVVFNKDFWNSLAPDVQKAITDALPAVTKIAYEDLVNVTAGEAMKALNDPAQKVQTLNWNATDTAKVNAVMAAYADQWAKDNDAKGLPASQVLKDYRALAEKYAPLSPYKK